MRLGLFLESLHLLVGTQLEIANRIADLKPVERSQAIASKKSYGALPSETDLHFKSVSGRPNGSSKGQGVQMDSDNGEMQYDYAIKAYLHTLCNGNQYGTRLFELTISLNASSNSIDLELAWTVTGG